MLNDLDETLAALVQAELGIPGVAISFVGPDDQFPPSSVKLPALSFFLYDVRQELGLRTTEWEVELGPDERVLARRRQPARVTCSYLITAWPSDSTQTPARDEHRMLGSVLKVLLRYRKIPAEFLQGELAGQEPPMPTRIVADNQLHSLGEFWQAMGGRPKASLHYGVTIGVDVHDPVPAADPVTERRTTINQRGAAR